jgi:uncharacterized protein (TIGR03086 family)
MASEISELLRRARETAVPVVQGISEDQFPAATPCADYDVRTLLNHLFHVVVSFRGLARRERVDMGDPPDYLTGDWRSRFEVESDRTVQAWSEPSALEGVSSGMGLPQSAVAQMLMLDLTVHSWDLAAATGQPHHPDPEVADVLYRTFSEMAPLARQTGVFGESVTVPDDASTFERLLGVSGRDPRWRG